MLENAGTGLLKCFGEYNSKRILNIDILQALV